MRGIRRGGAATAAATALLAAGLIGVAGQPAAEAAARPGTSIVDATTLAAHISAAAAAERVARPAACDWQTAGKVA